MKNFSVMTNLYLIEMFFLWKNENKKIMLKIKIIGKVLNMLNKNVKLI